MFLFLIKHGKLHLKNSKWEGLQQKILIEDYGFDKARKIVSQAIDLQKMNGDKDLTIPIIFSGTGGLALIPIKSIREESLKNNFKENQVLIFNLKKKSFQILKDTN